MNRRLRTLTALGLSLATWAGLTAVRSRRAAEREARLWAVADEA